MDRRDFRFFHRLRVRWPEVDAQRIVFNGQYLAYFDLANSAYWRAAAAPYPEAFERAGGDTFVKKATLEYHGSAGYDDFVDVGMTCSRVGNSSMTFRGGFFRGDELLATAELVYVFASAATRRPMPLPDALREAIRAFEAGEAMVDVALGTWAELGASVRALRSEDALDAEGIHAVARDRAGTPLATGRLTDEGDGSAALGGVTVRPSMRGSGMGRMVVQALLDAARLRGDREVTAQPTPDAGGFFARVGFRPPAGNDARNEAPDQSWKWS